MLKKIIFFMITSFISFSVLADTTANESLSQLLKNMHSLQADFTQTIVDKKGKVIQKNVGHMDLQRPSRFRWDVRSPSKQLIVTNGKKLWIYDPDLEQVTIRVLVKTAGETPAMLLSDENLSLSSEFSVSPINNASDHSSSHASSHLQWYLLIPKDQSSIISALKLGFQNQQIRQMQLEDHLGHTTMITFSNIKQNVPVSDSLFNFKPPAHIDIIDETKKH